MQQHKDKADRSKNKDWEKGEQYANGNINSKAISTVANALEQPGVDSGDINDVNYVIQAAQHYFENDYVYGRSRSRNPVNHFKFLSYMMDTDPLQWPDEAFSQLCQISKNYQFVVKMRV